MGPWVDVPENDTLGVMGKIFSWLIALAVFIFNMIFLKENRGKINVEISTVYAKLNDKKEPFKDIAMEDKI